MSATNCTRTADLAVSIVEDGLGESEAIAVSNLESSDYEYDGGSVAVATDWIVRVIEPIATESREEPLVSGGMYARGD